jgi:carboxypeptidase family protein
VSLLLGGDAVYACSCVRRGAACEVLQQTPLVFLGTVTDTGPSLDDIGQDVMRKLKLTPAQIETLENGGQLPLEEAKRALARLLPKEAQSRLKKARTQAELDTLADQYFAPFAQKSVTFRIEETFQGDRHDTEQIWTGYGNGDCGYDFQVGKSYLVYAYQDSETGRMTTGICTRTAPTADAADDLGYLHSVKLGTAKSWVSGYVTSDDQQRIRAMVTGNPPASPVRGASIELESVDVTRTTNTDAQGRFVFEDIAEGDYRIHVSAEGYLFRPSPNSFHIARYACSQHYLAGEGVTAK